MADVDDVWPEAIAEIAAREKKAAQCEAKAKALELDAHCLRIIGDVEGATLLQTKADQLRAGTYQEPPTRVSNFNELADALDAHLTMMEAKAGLR